MKRNSSSLIYNDFWIIYILYVFDRAYEIANANS